MVWFFIADFWLKDTLEIPSLYARIGDTLGKAYEMTDQAERFNALLFELRSPKYPRRLKVEIRKGKEPFAAEPAIAFSRYVNAQVPVQALSLNDVMAGKTDALIGRKEPRDAFDIEFLIQRGVPFEPGPERAQQMAKILDRFTKNEINVKLGSLLPPPMREVYRARGFSFLRMKLEESGEK